MVRKLNIPDQEPQPVEQPVPRARVLSIQNDPTPPVVATPAPRVRTLNIQNEVYVQPLKPTRPKTKTDELIDEVKAIDPTIDAIRLRVRIDTLLAADMKTILDWGESNLVPLRAASSIQSKIVARMDQINANGWLRESMEVSCKKPSLMDRLAAKKSPEYYEAMLTTCRSELMALVDETVTIATNYKPEVRDLQLDYASLLVVAQHMPDQTNSSIALKRAQSMQGSHQIGTMLLETIENIKLQVASLIQQIDDFMSQTLPAWKMANGKR